MANRRILTPILILCAVFWAAVGFLPVRKHSFARAAEESAPPAEENGGASTEKETEPPDGFHFEDRTVICNGESYSLKVEVEVDGGGNSWSVEYSSEEGFTDPKFQATDPGVYDYKAVLTQGDDCRILTATLTILQSYIETDSRSNRVKLSANDESGKTLGFAPGLKLSILESKDEIVAEKAGKLLESSETSKESVIGVYSLQFTTENSKKADPPTFDDYCLDIGFYNLDNADGVRLLQDCGGESGEMKELDYTFDDGVFTVKTDNLGDIAVVKSFAINTDSPSSVIIALIFGGAVLLALTVIVAAFRGNSRSRRYWRRRHSRWV